MAFEDANNSVPAEDSEIINDVEKAQAMADAGDQYREAVTYRKGKANFPESESEFYLSDTDALVLEEGAAEVAELYAGVDHDFKNLRHKISSQELKEIQNILDGAKARG